MTPKSYKDNFYSFHLENSLSSAREVIPVVLDFIRVQSVLDIGCGIGTWLKVWKENGVSKIQGVDGSYVNTEELLIEKNEFSAFDLEKGYSSGGIKYDLVSSLEVAEHISAENSRIFTKSLCEHADVILFSAAIPGQEGTLHINEQYPEYWQSIFAEFGFVAIDCLRKTIWNNQKIAWWYRQNILLFVKEDKLDLYPDLKELYKAEQVLPLVHPDIFSYKNTKIHNYEITLKSPVQISKHIIRNYLQKLKNILRR